MMPGKVKVLVAQSCPTLCDPMDCSPPGSSVSLFVMSGAGLIPSNFNAEASESKLSGRDVPMIMAFAKTLC